MIGIIGCGNMAQAIVKGFHRKNANVDFITYTPSYTRAAKLANEVNGKAVKELSEVLAADTIVIACKPQQLNDLANKIAETQIDLSQKHIISILAATPIEQISKLLKVRSVTRVMPNTPAMLGEGVSLVLHSDAVSANQQALVSKFFEACGKVSVMKSEEEFDKVTTVSGSGPAYVYLFAKTMSDKLINWGLTEEQAREIVIQLFKGSSELMSVESNLSFDELISKVTSKGGVTIEAVNSYRENKLEDLTDKALESAFARSIELTRESQL